MSTVLYILWQREPRTFANRAEAIAAAIASRTPLYSFDPNTAEWRMVAADGKLRGDLWVEGTQLPLQLWLMGKAHQRSGQCRAS